MLHKQPLPQHCPKCKGMLKPVSMLITDWPYIHTDMKLACMQCGHPYLFGVPLDKLSGSNLQIYDSNPLEILETVSGVKPPICPFHNISMTLTKIFGDKVEGDTRLQFKCKECYYLEHTTIGDS